ncbi:MAG: ABC transporter permease [Nitrososphaerota archaeon]|nr:ABC transporter permease [Nitrososphaerota archaeon]
MVAIRATRIFAFAAYEVRRALAKKKVLAVVAFTVLIDTVPYYILSTSGASLIPAELYPYLWTAGVIAPFALFIQFIAILIAAGAMSEEYEAGTAEILLAKPVSRTEFMIGKFLGGYLLLALLIVMNAALSVLAADWAFGPQAGLWTFPGVALLEIYSTALFFTVAFMIGELVRRSSLAYILSSALIVSSQIIGTYLSIAYELTGSKFYEMVHTYLPTTVAGSLPIQYEQSLLPGSAGRLFQLILGPLGGVPSEFSAAFVIAAYTVVAGSISLTYFRWADVSKRIS